MRKILLLLWLGFMLPILSQNKAEVDSINDLYIQGLNISKDSIVQLYRSNLEAAKKLNYPLGEADAYSRLSLIYSYQGRYDEATNLALRAIRLYNKLGLMDKVAYMYAELGYGMKYRDLPKGLHYMQMAKKIAEKGGLEDVQKDIYNNFGVLKNLQQEEDSALFYFRAGLEIKEKIGDSVGIPYSWSNMAGLYAQMEEFEKSRELFDKSLHLRQQFKDSTGMAENFTQLAEVDMAQNKYRNAISLINKSLFISRRKHYQNLTQYNYELLSKIYKELNKADSALYYAEQYMSVKDSIKSLKVEEAIAALNIQFETERKENEILKQKAELTENDLEIRRKNLQIYGSVALAIVFGLLGYSFFNRQKLKNRQLQKEAELKAALATIDLQNKLQEQRLRISRDLHDNIGSQLTFIISSIDSLPYRLGDAGNVVRDKLENISNFTSHQCL